MLAQASSAGNKKEPGETAGEQTPKAIWDAYFGGAKRDPEDVRSIILRLHQADKHEHVIAAIEAAMVNGQSQPWMYDVLALTMSIVKRPQAEIERALTSRIDFTSSDVPSMIYSAAYLTRFGAKQQALALYRQAANLDPARPEPYLMALKLAQQTNDRDALQWAIPGVLAHVWTKDHAKWHQRAEDAAVGLQQELLEAGKTEQAEKFAAAVRQARIRDLVLELTWSGDADIDLSVEEPGGVLCSFENPTTPQGGVHLNDGYGPKPENCYERYLCAKAAPGLYRVHVRYLTGKVVGQRARLKVIRHQGTDQKTEEMISVPIEIDKVIEISLPQGRGKSVDVPPKLP